MQKTANPNLTLALRVLYLYDVPGTMIRTVHNNRDDVRVVCWRYKRCTTTSGNVMIDLIST